MSFIDKLKIKNKTTAVYDAKTIALPYITCDTATGTAIKSTAAITGFTLEAGSGVRVKFLNALGSETPSLKIGELAAKQIIAGDNIEVCWAANSVVDFVFDGNNFVIVSIGAQRVGTVDNTLSTTSTNPVQNSTITSAMAAKADTNSLAAVATTGEYSSLNNRPTIPEKTSQLTNDSGYLTAHQSLAEYRKSAAQDTIDATKQATLVSGTNIKTINNISVLGSGNIEISGGGSTPSAYLKSAAVSGNTLTLTNKDDSTVVFSPSGTGEPSAYIKSVAISNNNITFTKKDDSTQVYAPNVGVTSVNGSTGAITGLATTTQLAAKSTVSVSSSGTATDTVSYITIDGVEKKLPTGGGSGGTSDFDALSNRPKYNGTDMTHSTAIPEVKTATWDAKQDAISDLATIRAGAAAGATALQQVPSTYSTTAQMNAAIAAYHDSTKQDTLTAGTGISISGNTISATNAALTGSESIHIDSNAIKVSVAAASGIKTTSDGLEVDYDYVQGKLTAGTGITINNNTISANATTYQAGTGLNLSGTTFSAKINSVGGLDADSGGIGIKLVDDTGLTLSSSGLGIFTGVGLEDDCTDGLHVKIDGSTITLDSQGRLQASGGGTAGGYTFDSPLTYTAATKVVGLGIDTGLQVTNNKLCAKVGAGLTADSTGIHVNVGTGLTIDSDNKIALSTTIPTKTSQLTNDSSFTTTTYVDTTVGTVNTRVTNLTSTVTSLDCRVDNIEDDYATSTALTGVSGRVSTIEADYAKGTTLSALDTKVTGLSTNLTALGSRVNSIWCDYATETDLTALETRVGTIEGNYATSSALTTLDNKVTGIAANLSTVGSRVNSIWCDYATGSALTAVDDRVSAIEDDYATESALCSLNTTVSGLSSSMTAIGNRVSAIEGNYVTSSTVSAIDNRLTAVEGSYATESALCSLSSTVSGLASTVSGLSETVSTISGDYATNTALTGVSSRVSAIEGDYATGTALSSLDTTVSNLAQSLSSIGSTVNAIACDYATGSEVDELATTVSGHGSTLTDHEERITALEECSAGNSALNALSNRISALESIIENMNCSGSN